MLKSCVLVALLFCLPVAASAQFPNRAYPSPPSYPGGPYPNTPYAAGSYPSPSGSPSMSSQIADLRAQVLALTDAITQLKTQIAAMQASQSTPKPAALAATTDAGLTAEQVLSSMAESGDIVCLTLKSETKGYYTILSVDSGLAIVQAVHWQRPGYGSQSVSDGEMVTMLTQRGFFPAGSPSIVAGGRDMISIKKMVKVERLTPPGPNPRVSMSPSGLIASPLWDITTLWQAR